MPPHLRKKEGEKEKKNIVVSSLEGAASVLSQFVHLSLLLQLDLNDLPDNERAAAMKGQQANTVDTHSHLVKSLKICLVLI